MSVLAKALEARSKKVNKVEMTKALKKPMEVHAQLEAIGILSALVVSTLLTFLLRASSALASTDI